MTQLSEPGAPFEERPLTELVGQLSRDGSLLLQQEIALAKAELGESAQKVKQGVAATGTGALVLYAGLLTLITAAVLLLSQLIASWLAAALVGAVVSVVGSVLLARGKKDLDRVELAPKRAIASVGRDVEMMKEAVR